MPDQADNLRHLIHTAEPPSHNRTATGPAMVVVTGGRPGTGATTVAVNLGAVLGDRGKRVLLVDAAEQRSNMAEVAGVRPKYSLEDVLAATCTLADAISPGPAGTLLLLSRGRVSPRRGRESSARRIFDRRDSPTCSGPDFSRQSQQRLLSELQSLGDKIDLLVVDVGSGLSPWTRRFWLRAQLVLIVATTEGAALIDSYAAIKRSVADAIGPETRLLVNRYENERLAADASDRFAKACRRFLGRTVPALPSLPRHGYREDASEGLFPRVWEEPDTPFGHAVMWLGRAVCDSLSTAMVASTSVVPFERKLAA